MLGEKAHTQPRSRPPGKAVIAVDNEALLKTENGVFDALI